MNAPVETKGPGAFKEIRGNRKKKKTRGRAERGIVKLITKKLAVEEPEHTKK